METDLFKNLKTFDLQKKYMTKQKTGHLNPRVKHNDH